MRGFFNTLFLIGNIFWIPFVIFKVYGWFFKEVGFNLPDLNYWNIFAIAVIFNIFKMQAGIMLELVNKPDKKDGNIPHNSPMVFALYAVALGMNYLIYAILF